MPRKRVLVIGMLDSIHLARWLSQFTESNLKILIFPSSHFRKAHAKLLQIQGSEIRVFGYRPFGMLLGYFDSIITLRFVDQRLGFKIRKIMLGLVVRLFRPETIHAIEIQHAGYLVSDMNWIATRRILTNWGSDIYYFQHIPYHKNQIERALQWASHYSAECERDYRLARDLGYKGIDLPRIPNAGGFDVSVEKLKCSKRSLILVKTYGGLFGAGETAIRALSDFLSTCTDFTIHFYSVTPDLESLVIELQKKFPELVGYSTLSQSLTHEELMKLFKRARIYLGCSRSDGLSTSFLQALCTGAYPIQTDTSCASELVDGGASGSIIPLDEDIVLTTLRDVIFDDALLDDAQKVNYQFSRLTLKSFAIRDRARQFYLD
jgi:glycosyltransferase involved in cell wall biosynthesis